MIVAGHRPLLGADWKHCRESQARPAVVNGLFAAHDLKKLIVGCVGDVATSLGSVGVERGWWKHHIRNITPTSVWARRSWLQYRATCTWKDEVRTCLRRLLPTLPRLATIQEMFDTEASAVGSERAHLNLSSVAPHEPDATTMNLRFDEFRHLPES